MRGANGRQPGEADAGHVTSARGLDVLRDPMVNKGTAFTAEERAELGLHGLLPSAVETTAHLREMLPIVYDPTVAAAIKTYSHEYGR